MTSEWAWFLGQHDIIRTVIRYTSTDEFTPELAHQPTEHENWAINGYLRVWPSSRVVHSKRNEEGILAVFTITVYSILQENGIVVHTDCHTITAPIGTQSVLNPPFTPIFFH